MSDVSLKDIEKKLEAHEIDESNIPYLNQATAKRCGCIVLEVKDFGPGMDTDQLKKLFGEGVQFNPNRLQAGNGIIF